MFHCSVSNQSFFSPVCSRGGAYSELTVSPVDVCSMLADGESLTDSVGVEFGLSSSVLVGFSVVYTKYGSIS